MKTTIAFLLGTFIAMSAFSQSSKSYNFYFGNLHAHTDYSDGNREGNPDFDTPAESFEYAKGSPNFDFLGISEHNHSKAKYRDKGVNLGKSDIDDVTITPDLFQKGLAQAKAATEEGKFIALYGLEWGFVASGHALIYGNEQLINWEPGNADVLVSKPVTKDGETEKDKAYKELFDLLSKNKDVFVILAHPALRNFGGLFLPENPYDAVTDEIVVGVDIRNGPAGNNSPDLIPKSERAPELSVRYRDLLAKGYHVGAGMGHDSHYTNYGRNLANRLVVLAEELTTAALLDAFRNRRFYGSDDWNCKVTFSLGDQPMGSITDGQSDPVFNYSITDEDGEAVKSVALMTGVAGSGKRASQAKKSKSAAGQFTPSKLVPGAQHYYYLLITQQDGDKIWTSPIWYTRK